MIDSPTSALVFGFGPPTHSAPSERWDIAEALLQHAEDVDDHNLPLMIWYGVEPLVPANPTRALDLAERSRIPLVTRYIIRRAAAAPVLLEQLVASIPSASTARQSLILDEILESFEGRVNIPMPVSWGVAYTHLLKSDDESQRAKADRIAIILGDKRLLPRMRTVLADNNATLAARQQALQVLVRARDSEAAPAFLAVLDEPSLRGEAIRALAAYDNPTTAAELLRRYKAFDLKSRRDTISTLTSRPGYALALLDAIDDKSVPRGDVHAYHVRQIMTFKQPELLERLQSVWGTVRDSSADNNLKIEQYKKRLTPDQLAKADRSNGRAVFNKTCAACHKLFGEGHNIGPDITGSNRANLDYILENAIDPSAVVSKDYKMSTLVLADGRVVTGLIEEETDSAFTVRTVNDVLLIAKSDVEDRSLTELSLMPSGQLDQLKDDEVRDLIAYLASPSQVPLPRIAAPIDESTGKVPGAIEGESVKVLSKTDGNVSSQGMANFKADRWSGNSQLWWTGQKVGSQLEMEVSVDQEGLFDVEVVLTRARDYGVVELSLNGQPLSGSIDCYVARRVDTTGVLQFGQVPLEAGSHRLVARVVGKNPKAVGFMFGLDYVRLTPISD